MVAGDCSNKYHVTEKTLMKGNPNITVQQMNESWVLQQSKVNLQSAGLPDTVDSCLGAEIGDPVKLQAKPNIFQSLFQAAFALHVVDPQTQPATEAVPSLYTIFFC